MMRTWEFSLVCFGIDDWTDEIVDHLHDKIDDAAFGMSNGVLFAEFDREADSASEAISGAVDDLERMQPLITVDHVEPDELVTMADIADRLNVSREAVRLWVTGLRGPGDFPRPAHNALGRSRLWHWPEVLLWVAQPEVGTHVGHDDIDLAVAIMGINQGLRARSVKAASLPGPAR